MSACAAEYSDRADRELARYVAATRKRLANDSALAEFDASQVAWEAYREAECNAVRTWWISGTIRGAKYQACRLSVTKARTAAIWSTWLHYVDNTPPIMPEPSQT